MKAAALKAEIESALNPRFGSPFQFRKKAPPLTMPTGVGEVDALAGGLPRGAITEIFGPASSGRTTLLYSLLAEATRRQEACALVDTCDTLDPASAAAAGVDFRQLLWVRLASNRRSALRVTDLVLQGGGFGLVVLDLGDIAPRDARRIPLNAWFRFRRAIENKPTVFVVIGQEPYAASSAASLLEMRKRPERMLRAAECGMRNFSDYGMAGALLRSVVFEVAPRKSARSATACFEAHAG